jgi:3'-phosphoadenosine 5'-phosphosulfate sulfotransferase (PAPS reductase)/FAD synthetase
MERNYFDGMFMDDAISIIHKAIEKYEPRSIWVAYSGGRDSAIVLDIASKIFQHVNVMAIDTGLHADGWKDMVRDHVNNYNATLEFASRFGWDWYKTNVMEYGFGYTPMQHAVYYRMLKERAIQTHIQQHKQHRFDRIMYLTGVRRHESPKRMKSPLYTRKGARVTVNPIAKLDNEYSRRYHCLYLGWYSNPYYESVGSSGDCLCGWTNKNSVNDIEKHHPCIGAKLKHLEKASVGSGGWRYNERPAFTLTSDELSDDMPDDSLCVNCYRQRLI